MHISSLKRWLLLVLALLLIVLSWWGIAAARAGLVVRSLERERIPLLYLAPKQTQKVPGVLVAHGFAGSKQLMLGYGHVLAHAGYAVMLWDFDGHGANEQPLKRFELEQNLDTAALALLEQPEVDRSRIALLGHSMGSGIVMSAGVRSPNRFAATIAISPTGAAVTLDAPRNLQLQAGSGEGRFVANAQRLLTDAGGTNQKLGQGKGRELVVVPNVEHITILFSDVSHKAALRWLNRTFGQQQASDYVDRRMAWYGLHLLGWLLLLGAVVSFLPRRDAVPKVAVRPWRSWVGLLLSPLAAVSVLGLLSLVLPLQSLGGVQVGAAIALWFLFAGAVWLIVQRCLPRPSVRTVVLGIGLFGLLWVAFGAMAQVVWLQWWLIPGRLRLWLPLAFACFPWFLASGIAQQGAGIGGRVAWWFAQSVVQVGGFLLTVYLLPQLGFVFLLLPLFPVLTAVLSWAAVLLYEPWTYAIGSALFFGWLLAAGFPLSA